MSAEASPRLQLPQLDPLEISSGMVFGPRRTPSDEPDRRPEGGPRETLEQIFLGALQRPPCVVAFSGGRDSSAILAEATRVARAHGLEDPIPHTLIFGDAPRAAEDEWQELVLRHLGIEEWSRRQVEPGELDSLGPAALEVLRRHGAHWPPNVHSFVLMLEPAKGGTLITGNGGDEMFAAWIGHRIALLKRGRTMPKRYDIRPFLMFHPPGVFLVRSRRRRQLQLPWLRADASREVGRSYARASTRLHRTWGAELEEHLNSRYLEVGPAICRAIARDAGAELVEPFFDPRFVRAVYEDAPAEGYGSRTDAMKRLFGDLLPLRVAARSSKAVFTEAFTGTEVRSFAERWSGDGLDSSLVDPEKLREAWLAPVPDARSLVPLQAAWLAND